MHPGHLGQYGDHLQRGGDPTEDGPGAASAQDAARPRPAAREAIHRGRTRPLDWPRTTVAQFDATVPPKPLDRTSVGSFGRAIPHIPRPFGPGLLTVGKADEGTMKLPLHGRSPAATCRFHVLDRMLVPGAMDEPRLALPANSARRFSGSAPKMMFVAGYNIGRIVGSVQLKPRRTDLAQHCLDQTQAFVEQHGNRAVVIGDGAVRAHLHHPRRACRTNGTLPKTSTGADVGPAGWSGPRSQCSNSGHDREGQEDDGSPSRCCCSQRDNGPADEVAGQGRDRAAAHG